MIQVLCLQELLCRFVHALDKLPQEASLQLWVLRRRSLEGPQRCLT